MSSKFSRPSVNAVHSNRYVGHQIGYGAYLWQIWALQCMGYRLLRHGHTWCHLSLCPNKRSALQHQPCALSLFRHLHLGHVSRQPAARLKLGWDRVWSSFWSDSSHSCSWTFSTSLSRSKGLTLWRKLLLDFSLWGAGVHDRGPAKRISYQERRQPALQPRQRITMKW